MVHGEWLHDSLQHKQKASRVNVVYRTYNEWVMKGVSLRDGAVQTLELEKQGSVAAAHSSDVFKKMQATLIFGHFLQGLSEE